MEGGQPMELMSKDTADKLDRVEQQIQSMQGEMLKASTETLTYAARLKLLEETDQRRETDIRELKEATRGMQRQFDQVVSKIDQLEMKLFGWMQQLHKDSSKERQGTQKEWMRFLQIVLGGTIFLIVAYVFSVNFK